MLLLVTWASVWQFQAKIQVNKMDARTCLLKMVACFAGLLLSPLIFIVLEFAVIFEGIGFRLPKFCQVLDLDMSTLYRSQSVAESLLNALPQSIIQSRLYVMGNDPGGTHVYINTTLFLYSVIGSFVSLLKTVALVMIEVHNFECGFISYVRHMLRLDSFEGHHALQGTSASGHVAT